MPIKNKVSGIYIITCNANNKSYIGQSSNLTVRWRQHKYNLKYKRHSFYLQEDYNKYGLEAFEFKILEVCDKEIRNEREKYWIAEYKSNIPEYGYNLQSGGHKEGFSQAESTKQKMSNASIGKSKSDEARRKMSEAKKGKPAKNKGVTYSDEVRRKMSEAKKGKPGTRKGIKHTEEARRKMSEAKKGVSHSVSDETKKKLSESLKGNQNCKGRKLSEEHKSILIESNKNRIWSEESRKKLSDNNGSKNRKGA